MRKRIPLRTLLFLILTTLSIGPVLLLGTQLKRPVMQRELDAVREKHLLVARHLTEAMDRYARDAIVVFKGTVAMQMAGAHTEELELLLRELHFRHICVVDAEGRITSSVVPNQTKLPGKVPPRLQRRLTPLLKEGAVTFAPVMAGPEGQPLIHMMEALPQGGYALAALKTDYLVELQKSIAFGRQGHAAIVDQTGKILAHPRESWRLDMKDISALDPVSRMMNGENGVSVFHSPALDQKIVAGFATSKYSGWGAMVPQPIVELEASAHNVVRITVAIGLLGALAAALLSWWLAGYLARPVVAVTGAARRVTDGEPAGEIRLSDRVPAELSSLAESFNLMVSKISQANRRMQASEARFKDFAETAADWFWETDAQHRFTYLSERFERSTGTVAQACLGSTVGEVFGSRIDSARQKRACQEALDNRTAPCDLELSWGHADGTIRIQQVSAVRFNDDEGEFRGYRGTGRDVTTARQLSQQLSHQASHDSLTGLVNRREFELQLARELEDVARTDAHHALCFLDLDQFKLVNDTSGHVAGDELLRQLGEVLKAHVRRGDTVARIGGDEFGVLLKNCSLVEALRVSKNLRNAVGEFRFGWEDKVFDIGVSIGLVAVTREAGDTGKLLNEADAACYAAKESGRNRVHVFRPDDEDQLRRQGELTWVHRLNSAIGQDALQLHCQEILSLHEKPGRERRCEILLRMETESGELVSAGAFLPAAERYNLATRIDRYVIAKAFDWFRRYPESARDFVFCTVNLSGQTLGNEEFGDYVSEQIADCPIDPQCICFEITETAAIASLSSASKFIRRVKQLGCRFALDDFGSGLCSFAYLKTLPVDYLKIDGAFVRDIAADPVDLTMVKSINDMAHALGKRTIAEFVESKAILDILRGIGVDYAQGYYISEPHPLPTQSLATPLQYS